MAEKRDAERTRNRLLEVATREFALHGYEGARVTRVVRAARVTARMLYHYFGDKEGLYVAVLDSVYAQIRDGERELFLSSGDASEALERFVTFTFDFFQENDIFVRLTQGENMMAGRHIKQSRMIQDMSKPLITTLDALIARGVAEGTFREHVDAMQLYVSIVAISAHHINNMHTLSAVFGFDLSAEDWIRARRAHAVSMVLRYVGARERD